jgi:hypothetical protein
VNQLITQAEALGAQQLRVVVSVSSPQAAQPAAALFSKEGLQVTGTRNVNGDQLQITIRGVSGSDATIPKTTFQVSDLSDPTLSWEVPFESRPLPNGQQRIEAGYTTGVTGLNRAAPWWQEAAQSFIEEARRSGAQSLRVTFDVP